MSFAICERPTPVTGCGALTGILGCFARETQGFPLLRVPSLAWPKYWCRGTRQRAEPLSRGVQPMKPLYLLSLLLPAVGVLAGPATAASLADSKSSHAVWHQMDNCKRQATKQFPDHTPQSMAQRDRAVQRCLDEARLPPVAPLAPAPAGSGSSR